ncbi:MAG: hypothetical protein ABSG98_10690 [Anaerolineales bacterium]
MKAEAEFTDWLLGASTPSIRYLTLTGLLGYSSEDLRARRARQDILRRGPAVAILGRQTPSGSWKREHSFYTPKYFSTHWSMVLLAELDVKPGDRRFRKGSEYMLAATRGILDQHMSAGTTDWSCLWGNLLRYAVPACRIEDPQVEQVVRHVCYDLARGPCRCRANDGRACAWGALRALWGLAAVPKESRTEEVESAIEEGTAFLLDAFRLEEADYPTPEKGRPSPLWFRMSFPLFYQADILFALRVLGELGLLDHPGAAPALDWVEQRRGKDGRWHGGSPYRRRTYAALGGRAETDCWVSLHAAWVLQQAGRLPSPVAEP